MNNIVIDAVTVDPKGKQMIYITGDTHGRNDVLKLRNNTTLLNSNKEDYLIIAGDFGGVWDGNWQDRVVQSFYNEQLYTTLFIDGNHENFDLLIQYPVDYWNGGKVHRISEKIIHLMRGQVFTIADKSIFTFGGGLSIDKIYRTPGLNWWPQEDPSECEWREAMDNLERYSFQIDYIVTHAGPESIVRNEIHSMHKLLRLDCRTEKFLDKVLESVNYKHWFCGHYHFDMEIPNRNLTVLYQKVFNMINCAEIE